VSSRGTGRLRLRGTPAALVLMGGGARAAYQVGVLKAIAAMLRDARRGLDPGIVQGHNPFPILVGTSAGAINAAALAAGSADFQDAVARIVRVWENFHAAQVYRSDLLGVLRSGARWLSLLSLGWLLRRSLRTRPRSLLDNGPLRELLLREVDFSQIGESLERGHLQALALGASSYTSGRHVTFYESLTGRDIADKYQRIFVRAKINVEHLLASSAIPFVFPAVSIDILEAAGVAREYFGDGAMRQLSPVSPAIHLGAERVLAVGVGQAGNPGVLPEFDASSYPSLAQVAGHALSTIFLDAIVSDAERLEKMNQVAATMSEHERRAANLRPIEFLMISPSERLDAIASRHINALPGPIRVMLEALGTHRGSGAGLASYLLFESSYTRTLIDLGYGDTIARRDEVMAFLTEAPGEQRPSAASRVVVL
jgi:NTE family protein